MNKMRLIDADKFLEKMQRTYRYFAVKFDIEEAPTVDAVPVVRCKDCINKTKTGNKIVYCDYFERDMMPDDFCSCGERKEQE